MGINGPGQSHKLSAPGAAVEERYGENLGVGQSTDVFSRSGKSIPIHLPSRMWSCAGGTVLELAS